MQFTVDDGIGNIYNFEFDSGPEVTFRHDPAGGVFVRDGDTFLLDGTAFEFDSGSVIVVSATSAAGLSDGDTLTITDNQVPIVTKTFEFDRDGTISPGNIRIPYTNNTNQADLIVDIVDRINTTANFEIIAVPVPGTNRIDLINESDSIGAISNSSAVIVQGAPGGSANLISFEESMTHTEFGQAIDDSVPGASADGIRLNFAGYDTGDFRQIVNRNVFTVVAGSDGAVTNGFIAIDFEAGDTSATAAQRAATLIQDATTLQVQENGGSLVFNGGEIIVSVDDPLRIGGTAPGGDITGLAFVNGTLYGVTAEGPDVPGRPDGGTGGGLYRILGTLSNNAVADYVETATDLLTGGRDAQGNPTGGPIQFSALSAGPENMEDGRFANMLFGMDYFGNLYAFNLQGELQPVFMDSRVSIPTGLTNLTGFAFSNLDINLWHTTVQRGNDVGHGTNISPDASRIADVVGGTSLYFAFENAGAMPGNWTGFNDPGFTNGMDFPGGAAGSIESSTFSLADYQTGDSPKLYFNYFLETENVQAERNIADEFMRDSFRVFASADDGDWVLLTTNNSFTGPGMFDDEFDYNGAVQETFDGTGWRQASVDLGAFVGEENVRLRFDFSTAGGFDIGNTGGHEIRAVAATEIADGDQLILDDATFEFDFGYLLSAPTGNAIEDGETWSVSDGLQTVTFEFDLGNGVDADNVPIAFDAGMSAFDVADSIENALANAFGKGVVQADLRIEQNDLISQAAESTLAVGTIVAQGEIGDNPVLFGNNTGRDVDLLKISLQPGQRVTLDVDTPGPTGLQDSVLRLFDDSGVEVAVNNNGAAPDEGGFTLDSYLDYTTVDGGVFYVGVSGSANIAYDPNVQGSGVTGATGTYQLSVTLYPEEISPYSVRRLGNLLNLDGIVNVSQSSADPGLQVVGEPGATGVAIPIDIHMTDEDVAWALRTALATEFGSGDPTGIIGYNDVVKIHGHDVFDTGPLGWDFFLDGDDTQAFNASTRPDGTIDNFSPGFLRGLDNLFEGVYIDDIIIGFAERGEMYTAAAGDDTFFIPDPADFPAEEILTGDYSVTIRSSEYYALPGGDQLILTETFQPQDRMASGVSMFVDPGYEVADGATFSISDGTTTVVFEFEEETRLDGAAAGNAVVHFSASDSAAEVANAIVDTINSSAVQAVLEVSASVPLTSNRIEFFGNAIIDTQRAVQGGELAESNDTIAEAVVSGIAPDTASRFTATGSIGDNDLLSQPGLDVDMVQFQLSVGQRVTIDVDSDDAPVDTVLRLFDANGNEVAFSDDTAAPGESPSREPYLAYTATVAGNYYVAVSGFSNTAYDPNRTGSGIAGNTGDYTMQIVVGVQNEVLEVIESDFSGDQNVVRDQGQLIIESTRITNSAEFGILIDAGLRNAPDNLPHQGTPRVLFETNRERLIPGVVIKNNVIAFNREGAIHFSGDARPVDTADSPVPFGRVINNTLVGGRPFASTVVRDDDPLGTGILVDENASPTLLNNIVSNFQIGIDVDTTSQSTVIGGTLYQGNLANSNKGLGDSPIVLGADDPLFVNADTGNFYLAPGSPAIDSSIDSLLGRPAIEFVSQPLGVAKSPILAPERDITGQLRVDDPSVDTPAGQGENVFKDRGAIDRADFVGPTAVLINPNDNAPDGSDLNPSTGIVQINNPVIRSFEIQLRDGVNEAQLQEGSGIAAESVSHNSVAVYRNGELLVEGIDYTFSFDVSSSTIRLTPLAGVWLPGRVYRITLDNSDASGIRDAADNVLQPNVTSGETVFTISIGGEEQDFGDAPDEPYPSLLINNGASHVIDTAVRLGATVTAEPDGGSGTDSSDDGVTFENLLVPGQDATVLVTASTTGKLDAWIDWDGNGAWGTNEQIADSIDLVAGTNSVTVSVPESATIGSTYARFRFSKDGDLAPTGLALNGEVEDYAVNVVSQTPWHNANLPLDVKVDGNVVPLDVLLVINELNLRAVSNPTTGLLPNPPVGDATPINLGYFDVDADGYVSPRDALLIINELNRQSVTVAAVADVPEGESLADQNMSFVAAAVGYEDLDSGYTMDNFVPRPLNEVAVDQVLKPVDMADTVKNTGLDDVFANDDWFESIADDIQDAKGDDDGLSDLV
ncbi:MAG: pre-peptidase C-terminal domain-containing protein [Planctomycetales bacterium]|nr:pre-peptidase C-terminal domain-containing protein [Planctomycetales bacterium]